MNTALKFALNSIVLWYMNFYTISNLKFSEELMKESGNYMYVEFVLSISLFGIATGYIWKTRDRKRDEITEQEKQRRYTSLFYWIVTYFFSSVLMIIYTNIMKNNEINNFLFFYVFYNFYICIGVCTLLYGKTRLFLMKDEENNILSLILEPIMIISTTFPSLSNKPLQSIIIYSLLISIAFIYTSCQCFKSSSLQNIFKK